MESPDITPEQHELVRTLARRAVKELGLRLEIDDLESYGYKGLLEAHKRWDEHRAIPLERYAYYRVRGAIRDGVREMAKLPRRAHEALKAEERADLAMEEGGERAAQRPTDGDFAGGARSIDDLMGIVAAAHIATAAANASATTEESLITQLDAVRLHKAIDTLASRARKFVQHFYFEELGLEGTGAALGMSKSNAFRLHAEVLGLLREKLS